MLCDRAIFKHCKPQTLFRRTAADLSVLDSPLQELQHFLRRCEQPQAPDELVNRHEKLFWMTSCAVNRHYVSPKNILPLRVHGPLPFDCQSLVQSKWAGVLQHSGSPQTNEMVAPARRFTSLARASSPFEAHRLRDYNYRRGLHAR